MLCCVALSFPSLSTKASGLKAAMPSRRLDGLAAEVLYSQTPSVYMADFFITPRRDTKIPIQKPTFTV